jgi:hypothetical protein
MIHAGETIDNPVAGERIRFRQTSRETGSRTRPAAVRRGRAST